MTQLQIFMPLPRLHVFEEFQYPNLTLSPPQCDAEQPEAPPTKQQRELRAAVSCASEEAYIVFPDGTVVFRDGAEDNNLAEALTAMAGVTENDFRHHTVLAMPFEATSFEPRQQTRQGDRELVAAALEHADAALDGIRFNLCRLDVPEMSLGPPGYLPDKGVFAVYFHVTGQDQGRFIACEPPNPVSIPGVGVDLHSVQPSSVDPLIFNKYGPGTLGVRLKRLLRMYCQSFVAPSDEIKILSNVFAMDGCLTPESSKDSNDFKKFVGMAAGGGASGFRREYEGFRDFYSDVRNPLVHHGKQYAELGRDRRRDLIYLQGLIHLVLENLTTSADEQFYAFWANTLSLANQQP